MKQSIAVSHLQLEAECYSACVLGFRFHPIIQANINSTLSLSVIKKMCSSLYVYSAVSMRFGFVLEIT